jgi:ABC-type bacteriocin/lantibiotic exporter with double-glycine peptidase domain
LRNNGANVSGGQRARLMLARALCLNSEVILCDEIFSSLEQSIARSIEKDILSLDKTIINVSHIIFKDQLHLYDKIYIVDQGTIRLTSDIQEVWSRMILTDA